MRQFCVGNTNLLLSKRPCPNAKHHTPNANSHRPNVNPHGPNATPHGPNASKWNIVHVGSPCVGARVGHVHFMFFVSTSFPLGSQCEPSFRWNMGLKPIFHCDTKSFALGTGFGLDPQRHTFALPNAKDTNMLVSFALVDANFSRHLTQNPQRESVEYRLRWVPNAKSLHLPCTFHVVCVNFICVR